MSRLKVHQIPCLSDNYGYLVHDPDSGLTAAIDTPEVEPIHAALNAKGFHYRYVFSRQSRHCDRRVFEHTLADTLVWMWRGYHPDGTDD